MALLAQLACGGSSDSDDARDLALASISSRIDNTNQRLEALATKVDATAERVETIAAWTVDRPESAPQPEPETELPRVPRVLDPPSTREPVRSPDLKDPFAPDTESDTDGAPRKPKRYIEGSEEAIECTETGRDEVECTVDAAFLKELHDNPALLARQARFVPSTTSGGIKLYGIRRHTIPKMLLINNGDSIVEINGKAVIDIEEVRDALAKFAKGKTKKLTMELDRKGTPWSLKLRAD